MTWTYSGNPSATTRDEVRFLVGDTDTSDQLVTDEEIAYAYAARGSAIGAAAWVARALSAKFARFVDTTVGQVSESASQRAEQYKTLAETLEAKLSLLCDIVAGGVDVGIKESLASDTNAVQPKFAKDTFDNPGAGFSNNAVLPDTLRSGE